MLNEIRNLVNKDVENVFGSFDLMELKCVYLLFWSVYAPWRAVWVVSTVKSKEEGLIPGEAFQWGVQKPACLGWTETENWP